PIFALFFGFQIQWLKSTERKGKEIRKSVRQEAPQIGIGSRSGANTGERNSVSRARCKRQSKDLMQWMEETSTAVEKLGKDRPIWQRKTTVQHQGHGVAPATPRKKTEWKAGTLSGCCCRSGHFARTGHGLPYGDVRGGFADEP